MVPERFLRISDVEARTGLARSTIYLRISRGRFPRSVPVGEGPGGPVRWLESEIDNWIREQIRAARPDSDTGALPPAA